MKKILSLMILASLVALSLAAEEMREEKIAVAPGGLLEVDLDTGGRLEVSGWDEAAVLVRSRARGDGDGQVLTVEKTADGVRVEAEHTGSWGRRRSGGYDLEIKVPRRFDLDLETMGGGLYVADVEGDLEGETMGGEVMLSGLKGEIEFSTMGGNIELRDSDVDGEIETMGGKVVVENVTGDVDGSSMGGSVIYRNVTRRSGESTGEAVVITTMGGEIEIESAPFGARLETMGGEIRVGSASKFVDAETMGGDIFIGSVDGWVDAETMGGDVEVTVVGDPRATDRDIKLSSMGGEIRLTVPRGFSMEVDIEISYDGKDSHRPEIISDLPLTVDTSKESGGFWPGRGSARVRGTGTFAGGRNKVEIETVGGDVYLRQSD